MKQLVTVWIEWDYGQEHVAFTSLEKAKKWVDNLKIEFDEDDGNPQTFDALEAEGLCGFRTITLDP